MSTDTTVNVRCLWGIVACIALGLGGCAGPQQAGGDGGITNSPGGTADDEEVALNSLMALADGHLRKIADVYSVLAAAGPVGSGRWEQVRGLLADAASVNVPALFWFALPDGSYWTLEEGRAAANLADRAYFARVLAGQTVIGELVVSRATGKSAAVVAVPVLGDDRTVVGVLGASVYLDSLSELIEAQMGLAPDHVFFSIDATPIVGLHKDPETIFVRPLEEDDPQLTSAIREILSREQGIVSYRFRGQSRTIHYRRSPVTGWWYGFGRVHE